MIKSKLGGISMPSSDEPAVSPTANFFVYPWRTISGTAIFVKIAAAAIEMANLMGKLDQDGRR